jgi:hypothetical protein
MKKIFLCISAILVMTISINNVSASQQYPQVTDTTTHAHTISLIAGMLSSCALSLFTIAKAHEDLNNPMLIPLASLSLITSYTFLLKLWEEQNRVQQLPEQEQQLEHRAFVTYVMEMPEN